MANSTKTDGTIEGLIEAALRQTFEKKQQDELLAFNASLPKEIERRKKAVTAALQADGSPKRRGRPAGAGTVKAAADGSRKSWGSLPDSKKETWIEKIVDAGKGKKERGALIKSFEEAEGFKLRASIIDRVQLDAANAGAK